MTYVSRIIKGGKVALPASIRRALVMPDGEKIFIEKEEGRIVIRTQAQAIREAQAELREYVPEGVSLVDELIADRRREAEKEDEESRASIKRQA